MTHYYAIVDKETGEVAFGNMGTISCLETIANVYEDKEDAEEVLSREENGELFKVIPVSIVPIKNKKK